MQSVSPDLNLFDAWARLRSPGRASIICRRLSVRLSMGPTNPKGPCTGMVYTWAVQGLLYPYFRACVSTIKLYGPFWKSCHMGVSNSWGSCFGAFL